MASTRRVKSPGSIQGLDARRIEKTPGKPTGDMPGAAPGVFRVLVFRLLSKIRALSICYPHKKVIQLKSFCSI